MRKAARAKAIIELAVPVPLDNTDESAQLHEETFDIGPVSNPEDTPEEPEPLNEDKLADIRVFKQLSKFSWYGRCCISDSNVWA